MGPEPTTFCMASRATREQKAVETSVAERASGRVARSARFNEPGLVRVHDGLCPVAELKLREDVRDVGLNRRFGDDELGGDLRVGVPASDELEHLELARGQLFQA